MDPFLGSGGMPPIQLDDLLQPEFLFDPTQLTDDDSPAALQPSGSPPTNDHLLIPPTPVAPATVAIGFDGLNPAIHAPPPPLLAPSPAPAIVAPIPKAGAKKAAARKRGRSAAPSASADPTHFSLDTNADFDDEEDTGPNILQGTGSSGADRSRLRTNETKYRQGMQQLFDALGKALGQPGLGKR
jgi:hypothetical protein